MIIRKSHKTGWANYGDVRTIDDHLPCLASSQKYRAPPALHKGPTAFSSSLALSSSVLTLQKCHSTLLRCFQCQLARSGPKLFQKATATYTATEQWLHQ